MDLQKQRHGLTMSNGFILPEGKMTPNTLFVGGIDMKVEENEIRDFFARYGAVKEVKIITYRGGICKGYGFVYFSEDVDIQTIVEQQVTFKGKKLKLGPAIMKERSSRESGFQGRPWLVKGYGSKPRRKSGTETRRQLDELCDPFWHLLQLRWYRLYRLAFPPDSTSNAERGILALGTPGSQYHLPRPAPGEVTPASLSQRRLNTESSSHQ
ncbi:hypothetical protein PDJAM_G00180340 [Pangasius djambal]|uniref:Uncharacterized protein n=1 Tax=Pangasius djambal TaxID=1691987 RepID=A0ACC5ZP19_9TELE|nr:hypothetical protein [Pangasius djambal]